MLLSRCEARLYAVSAKKRDKESHRHSRLRVFKEQQAENKPCAGRQQAQQKPGQLAHNSHTLTNNEQGQYRKENLADAVSAIQSVIERGRRAWNALATKLL